MGSGGRGRMTPEAYIRSACKLHLQAKFDPQDESSSQAIAQFLSQPESNDDIPPSPRLFVWIPRRINQGGAESKANDTDADDDTDEDFEYDLAMASTEAFDGNNLGALAFINTTANATSSGRSAKASTTPDASTDGAEGKASTSNLTAIRTIAQIQCMTLAPKIELDSSEAAVDSVELIKMTFPLMLPNPRRKKRNHPPLIRPI